MSMLVAKTPILEPDFLESSATIRDEPLNLERLEQFAVSLAASITVDNLRIKDDAILNRARANATALREAHRQLLSSASADTTNSIDVDWLLDNFSVVEDQLREIEEDLPRTYFHELPKTSRRLPRVYEIALAIIAHTDSAPDEETLVRFLNAFQTVAPLSIGESWAFPIMLRVGLIENLRRIAHQIIERRHCKEEATRLVNQSAAGAAIRIELDSLEQCAPTIVEVLTMLEENPAASTPSRNELEQRLRDKGWDIDEILRDAHRRQAANQVTIGNLITSMRLISALDWMAFFEQVSLVERKLREDPSEVYPRMDSATRDRYRNELERIAKRSEKSDLDAANSAIEMARKAMEGEAELTQRHIGHYILGGGKREFRQLLGYRAHFRESCLEFVCQAPIATYLGGVALVMMLTLGAVAYPLWLSGFSLIGITLLLLAAVIPASELSIATINFLVTTWLPPQFLPKLEFKEGVPASRRTLVVIPALLTSQSEIESLVQRLESHYLANPDAELRFALLTDWVDSTEERSAQDQELVDAAVTAIRTLNQRHGDGAGGPFLLFHRRRLWNPSEACWMGWERKRGKLMELHQWLLGEATSFETVEGESALLTGATNQAAVRYIITLDADTLLPPGAARKLVGAISHPLNQPQVLEGGSIRGYALLQPRVGVTLTSANQTWFSRIFANSPGLDPYSTAASDVYQDLFGEGSFTGKGIYDLQTFHACLKGTFPENHILSHDLIEGCHSRVGLLSDVEVIDGFPARYEADARRQHRWVRGDWQLLPWLLPRVPSVKGFVANRLSAISRWKIMDNLRRSTVPLALVALFITGWAAKSFALLFLGALIIAFPLMVRLIVAIMRRPRRDRSGQFRYAWQWETSRAILQCLLQLVFLPHRAFYMTDAIGRTLWRLLVSRRRLLEWESAAVTEQRLNQGKGLNPSLLWLSPLLAVGIAFVIPWESWATAAPILLGWTLAPLVVLLLNRGAIKPPPKLTLEHQADLRRYARRTWSYFEEFVNENSNWLPPDNVQEHPMRKVALRVSPTNEGLFLLSGLVARDFGFISLKQLCSLWEKNLATWDRLEGLRGHTYNWYDAQTLEPLRPQYVSTVDSGNLAVSFLTAKVGAEEMDERPLFKGESWLGIIDTLYVVKQVLEDAYPAAARTSGGAAAEISRLITAFLREDAAPDTLLQWRDRLAQLRELSSALAPKVESLSNRRPRLEADFSKIAHNALRQFEGIAQEFDELFAWADHLAVADHTEPPRWKSIPPDPGADCLERNHAWQNLVSRLQSARSLAQIATLDFNTLEARNVLRREWKAEADEDAAKIWIDELEARIRRSVAAARDLRTHLATKMEFGFLYNSRRRLFSIGFNVDEGRLDQSHYDMLASEARLAAYFAIAKGDTDYRSWFHMGRGLTQAASFVGLVSWGGTMFEYLMPLLFQKPYTGSLIAESCKMAVARQQEYGRQCNVPWGISESAFSSMAANHDYHYRSFGVPGIGLKRGLGKDLVISPYSTLLALEFDPLGGFQNLQHLAADGALGPFGFFDSIDYTRSRMPKGKRSVVVRCYMAHHHGMSMLAVANLLHKGSIRQRFHRHPLGRAGELLLQEKMPDIAPLMDASDSEHDVVENPRSEFEIVSRKLTGYQSASPKTHLLTNGRYSLMITSAGSGYSQLGNTSLTRWRRDAVTEQYGQFIYLRDRASGRFWSAGYQPTRCAPAAYETIFSIDKAEIRRRDREVETHLEVSISPDHDVELRTLKITNHSNRPLELEVTSYAEVVLGSLAADIAHPAFQKLFVETEILAEKGAIISKRRPRSATESALYAFHVIDSSPQAIGDLEFESSREHFLGRGRNVDAPKAMLDLEPLSGRAGAVLDPIFAIRQRVAIPPHERAQLTFTSGIASSREEAITLIELYRDPRHVTRAFEMAWAFHQAELRQLHITPAKSHLYQRWAGSLIFPDATWRAPAKVLHANRQGQPALWRYGVSGDFPVLVARFSTLAHLDSIRELLIAHRFWRRAGLIVDLVLVNDHPGSYVDEVQDQLIILINEVHHQPGDSPPNIATVRSSQVHPDDLRFLEAAASVVLQCDETDWERTLGNAPATPAEATPTQNNNVDAAHTDNASVVMGERLTLSAMRPDRRMRLTKPHEFAAQDPGLQFANPWGGFTDQGRAYQISLKTGNPAPKPWSNILANPQFGALVTETGGGFTWFGNSREFKLTSWTNDTSADSPSERLYLRDEQTGEIFFPLPQAVDRGGEYKVTHSAGFSRFTTAQNELKIETTLFVDVDDPIKVVRIEVLNTSAKRRELSLTYFVEWVLGVNRETSQLHVRSEYDKQVAALLARNPFIPEFADYTAFLAARGAVASYLPSRQLFFGRLGDPIQPAALRKQSFPVSEDVGGDPGGAAHCVVMLEPGEHKEIAFLVGACSGLEKIPQTLKRFETSRQRQIALERVVAARRSELEIVSIETPSAATNILMNHWLLHQVLSCRIWGRSGFYQSGGAYGFRDQLQDVMAIVYSRPDLARDHLLRAASRQYLEGDVQHWWHPPVGRGTRTRFSDDYLWLVLTTAHYVKVSGDAAVLEERTTFLRSPPLEPHEQERYELPTQTEEDGSLYEHCLRTLDRAFRLGRHGLPLMGCGDWNDGMNKVGEGGEGESVWMGWFLLVLLEEFLPIMRQRGDSYKADTLAQKASDLRVHLEKEAWDGAWYKRAFFDDGTPLGSSQNDECQIDSIAQSWAVMANADHERSQQAMNSVWDRLVRKDVGLVLLFAPPFQSSALDPGYIKGYLAGIRENGGQYTHAALWVAQALALQGETDRAWEILEMINPIHHGESEAKIRQYQVEPYVVAADVYGVPPNLGRGGWSWYTGSAGWMYRIILETVLGFELRGDRLSFHPRIPSNWPGFELTYRYRSSIYRVKVRRSSDALSTSSAPVSHLTIDGRAITKETIDLVDDGKEHEVEIECSSK
jgi:cyclic beta-1,2-glucan synthetase